MADSAQDAKTSGRFAPDYAIAPGETLRETIEALGMSQVDLALRTQLSMKHINQIIQGHVAISPDTALALEKVTGVPARFWVNLEANHQERLARARDLQERAADVLWAKKFPISDLVRRGFVQATKQNSLIVSQLLSFFGVASRAAWEQIWLSPEASYRKSAAFKADPYAMAAWLRIGELRARSSNFGEPFDRAVFRDVLRQARAMTGLEFSQIRSALPSLCAQAGVALVIVKELKGCRVSGATRWLTAARPLIQLSLRYTWEDQFWFSFFHEGGHVLLHGKKRLFVADGDTDSMEDEADEFAATFLIPRSSEHRLLELRNASDDKIARFAAEIQISPAVVVGRLQRERLIPFSYGRQLRRQFVGQE